MIVYFSGTGNSLDLAERLAEKTADTAIDVADIDYDSTEKPDVLGIVYPVYFGGLPLPIIDFANKYDFAEIKYIYSVATYGGSMGGADAQLSKLLKKRSFSLDASFGFLTPDNYLPLFNPPTEEQAAKTLEKTYAALPAACEKINAREKTKLLSKPMGRFYCNMFHKRYLAGRKTEAFYVTDACVKCGLCAKNCPAKVIELDDSTVKWVEEQCYFCMGCINRCPKRAIQYGKATETRGRYVNPRIK